MIQEYAYVSDAHASHTFANAYLQEIISSLIAFGIHARIYVLQFKQ